MFPWGHGVTELQSSIFRVEPCNVLMLWHNFSRSPGDSLLPPNPVTPQVPEIPLMTLCYSCYWTPTYGMWEAAFVPVVFVHVDCLVSAAASTGTVPPHPGLAYLLSDNDLCLGPRSSYTQKNQTCSLCPLVALIYPCPAFSVTSLLQRLTSILYFSRLAFHRFFPTKMPTFHKTGIWIHTSGNACAFLQYFLFSLRMGNVWGLSWFRIHQGSVWLEVGS